MAIVVPSLNTISETFVAAHIRCLAPERTVVLCEEGLGELALATHVFGPGRAAKPWPLRKLLGLADLMRTGIRFSLDFAQEAASMAFLREHRVRIVLAEYGPLGCRVAPLCERIGLPLFVHFHGYDASQRLRVGAYRRAYRRLVGKTAAFFAPSQYLADKLAYIGIPRDHLHVIPCGVEPEAFPFAARPPDGQRVLAVGRLVDKKAPHLLIAAFADLAMSRPDATLEIIGDGPLMDRCRGEVHVRGLTGRVVLHGARSHGFVKQRMRAATVFAQHSVTASNGDTEGLPVAILEAMMSGLPVVSTRHAGIPEAVLDGETGLLVSEGDIVGMGRALEALLADPRLVRRMGHAGHSRAIGHFTHASSIARLRQVMRLDKARMDAPSQPRPERVRPLAREPFYEA